MKDDKAKKLIAASAMLGVMGGMSNRGMFDWEIRPRPDWAMGNPNRTRSGGRTYGPVKGTPTEPEPKKQLSKQKLKRLRKGRKPRSKRKN